MNKTEYREHCKKQIERCIKLNDTKHLREHELSLSLLNECEERKREKDSLIKHLEDKITHLKQCQSMALESRYKEEAREFNLRIADYQEILERLKNNNYD